MAAKNMVVPLRGRGQHAAGDASGNLPFYKDLPEEPFIRIRPGVSRFALGLRDAWARRELFYYLMWRDLKVRYKQTVLGAAWVLLQPILTTLIFTIFLAKLMHASSDGVPYPLFAFAGLLLWTFFSNAVLSSGHSLVASAHLLTKIYFPRIIIPGAAIGVRLVDFVVASVVLLGLMFYYGVEPTWRMLLLPLVLAELTLLAAALGVWAAALNVRFRDVGTVLPVVLQLLMFLSPIVYPATVVPEKWRWLYGLNPLTGIVEGFRAVLFGTEINSHDLISSAIITSVLFVLSVNAFRRMEEGFADVV